MSAVHVIGLDVGGTKIAAGLLACSGGQAVGTTRQVPTGAVRGGQAVLAEVLSLAEELARDCAAAGGQVAGVGVGLCELVDGEGRPASANAVDWVGLPVADRLAAVGPVVIEADVRAAALAEARLGAGRPFRHFLYVTVGTGISCCLMVGGEPYQGAGGFTGTMGSSVLAVPCERCGATGRRTLEDLASGPGLVARFRAAGGSAETGVEVLRAAGSGEAEARQVVASAGEALGSQLALLVGTLDPEAVVVGGGLGLAGGLYWERMTAAIRRDIWSDRQRGIPILRAERGPDAGWIGAALCAAQRLGIHLPPPEIP